MNVDPRPSQESLAPTETRVDLDRPWVRLLELAEAGHLESLQAHVQALGPGECARGLSHLSSEEQGLLLLTLGDEGAADLLGQLSRTQAVEMVEGLPAAQAASILNELPDETEADILRDLDDEVSEAVLAALPPEEAAEARALKRYEDDSAGGLMTPDFAFVSMSASVEQVVAHLRAHSEEWRDYQVQYVYVLDADGGLRGVLRLRDLLLAPALSAASALMIPDPVSVEADTTLFELTELFDKASYFGLPVVDHGRMVGVVRRASVEEAVGEEAYRDHLKTAGIVGGEELRGMGLGVRARRRLQWLSINVLLNILAASVIAFYQDTLTAVIALAVFLPIISDMSGCSGNQAVAVSMRELSLGVARPRDVFYVWGKEVTVGIINGSALGLLLGGVAYLWKGNVYLGLVVGGALALNTLVAVSIGGTVPLVLRGLGIDPALASGPVLTTITDLCGFLLVLGMATALLPHLV